MKTLLIRRMLLHLSLPLVSLSLCHASSIAVWTFEPPNRPNTVVGPVISGLRSTFGGGTASGVHAYAYSLYMAAYGNGSPNSLMATNWQAGDYWQFQVSTRGFKQIGLSLDIMAIMGNANGPTNCTLAYSRDGTSFTTWRSNLPVLSSRYDWDPNTYNPLFHVAYDLSSVTALDNAATIYLRLIANVPPVMNGSQYIDNVTISGIVVPEPASVSLLCAAAVGVALHRRNRRGLPRA